MRLGNGWMHQKLQLGEFNGDGDRLDVAVGMPRGANLTGKVGTYNSAVVLGGN